MPSHTIPAAAIVLSLLLVPGLAGAEGASSEERAYVVGFHAPPGAMKTGDRYQGGRVAEVDSILGFARVMVRAADAPGFETRAARAEGVRYVEADPEMLLATFTPNDPRFAGQYGLGLVGAPAAWDATRGSASVSVCVADSGLRHTHEDLAPLYAGGYDFVNADADPWDDNGHGTHATGIAAAAVDNGKGVAGVAGVSIRHAKVLDASGYGAWSRVASGIRWCADQGAASISLSLGGSTGSTALQDAVDYAWSKGAVVAAATGNNGCADCVLYPAKYANAIAVGCVNSLRDLCAFSNQGPEVDLVAPGSGIDSTYHSGDASYVRMSGTSMSTPFVAGAAALLKARDPTLTNARIRELLQGNAEDRGAAGWDAGYGHGLLRVDRAMAAIGPAPEPTPTPAPALPDLVVQQVAVAPSEVTEGQTATFTAYVHNQGAGDAGAFVLRYLLDGAVLCEISAPGLAAGGTLAFTRDWTAYAGSHVVEAVADAAGAVAEANETDNRGQAAFSVAAAPPPPPAEPDLRVDAPRASPAAPTAGQATTLSATVTNGGAGNAGAFAVRFLVDGALVGETGLAGLAAGASATVSVGWTTTSGQHAVEAVVDPAGAVAESDESNNRAQSTLNVSAPITRGVDLSPEDATRTIAPGKETTYDVVVTNTGSATDTITLGLSGSASGWKVSLGASSVTLGPGASAVVKLTVKAPRNAKGTSLAVSVTGVSAADAAAWDAVTTRTYVA